MTGLTFYGILADLAKMKEHHEDLKTNLLKLERTYEILKYDERFQGIKAQVEASLTGYGAIISKYDEMNRVAEEEADKPVDYRAAFSYVIDTDLQETCKHPTDSWVRVINVPVEKRQYERSDTDFLCGMCGLLVPPFGLSIVR